MISLVLFECCVVSCGMSEKIVDLNNDSSRDDLYIVEMLH